MNEFTFMSTKEDLKDTLKHIKPNFSLLTSLLTPNVLSLLSETDKDYCSDCLVIANEIKIEQQLNGPPKSMEQLVEQVVLCLLYQKQPQYVQCLGQWYKDFTLKMKSLNYAKAIIEANSTFRNLFALMPYKQLFNILLNYTIVVPYKDEYVQVTGPLLNDTYNMKAIGSRKKKYIPKKLTDSPNKSQINSVINESPPRLPIINDSSSRKSSQSQQDKSSNPPKSEKFLTSPKPKQIIKLKGAYSYSQQNIKRFQIFYCSSMNRASGLFKRNIFFDKGLKKAEYIDECKMLVEKCMKIHFLSKVNLNQKDKASLQQHIFTLFQKMRTLLEVRQFKGKKTSRFDILLHNHCKLNHQYHEVKTNVLDFIQERPHKEVGTLFNDLYNLYTPYQGVKNLIVEILNTIVPKQLLGADNMKILGAMMKDFVLMKRFQNYRIQDFLSNLDVFGMKWLPCKYNPKFKRNIITRRRKVLAMIVVFLVNEIVVPIIKFNFYVTEKHKEANKIFYYRKPIWTLVSKLAIKRFSQQNLEDFDQLKAFKMKKSAICPEGKLRLLPKNGTFRPILTFNRKIEFKSEFNINWKYKLTLNQYLADTQLVLRNLKNILGNKFGYSVFDNRQIMKKYDTFVDKWRKIGSPPMKYFTLDIHKCYDSIDTSLLLKFIEETPYIDDQYLIVKYNRLYRNKRPLFGNNSFNGYFNYKERVTANSMIEDLIQIKEEHKMPSINIFPGKQRLITKTDIINKLRKICEGSIVGYRKHYWLQKLGIPQGLNVSGVLCSLYFACLQDNFVKVKDGLLMRLTDDYLYIGPEAEAVKILDNLLFCAKKYNFRFSEDKISKNFDHPLLTKRSPSQQILWIGKRINIQTLQMSPNFEMSERVFYSMNVNVNRHNVKSFLKNKLKSLLTNHFSSYFKPKLFPYDHIASNVRLYVQISLQKFYPFLKHVVYTQIEEVQVLILKILKSCIHEFLLFACMLADSINDKLFYKKLYVEVTGEVAKFFKSKNHPEFKSLYKIFEADSKRERDTLPQ